MAILVRNEEKAKGLGGAHLLGVLGAAFLARLVVDVLRRAVVSQGLLYRARAPVGAHGVADGEVDQRVGDDPAGALHMACVRQKRIHRFGADLRPPFPPAAAQRLLLNLLFTAAIE